MSEWAYLVARPHPSRRQLALRGRNMTVGQMVATMNANHWSAAETADQLELPLEQVSEALRYYAEHHELVDAELREEARQIREAPDVLPPPRNPRSRNTPAA